jgi:excisionase family DNA binding protein
VAVTKKVDAIVYGLSGAANFLGCAEETVQKHADAGRLRCTRDSSNKRLFKHADLEAFQRSNQLRGNRRLPPNDARNSAPFSSLKKKRSAS